MRKRKIEILLNVENEDNPTKPFKWFVMEWNGLAMQWGSVAEGWAMSPVHAVEEATNKAYELAQAEQVQEKEYRREITEDEYGVHATHCCVLHGCKYGDENCPVVEKKVKQVYTCESCDWSGIKEVNDIEKFIIAQERIKKATEKINKEVGL